MANNINTLTAGSGAIKSGASITGRTTEDSTIKSLNNAASVVSGIKSTTKSNASSDDLNTAASVMSGINKTAWKSSEVESVPSPDEDIYSQFMNTVAPYVKMSDEEKQYYYSISGIIAKNGGDVSAWAQDFLATNAIANALNVDRMSVNTNRAAMLDYYLGIEEDKPLEFTTAASIINSFKQGQRQQDMAHAQEEFIQLYRDGYDDNSDEIKNKAKEVLQVENEINYFQDTTPRWITTKWVQNSISQLPYMMEGTISGLAGTLLGGGIGLLAGGPAGAVTGARVGSSISRLGTYQTQFEASAFWNMKQAGVSTETALKYSAIDGLINGANEAFLDAGYNLLLGGLGKAFGISDLSGSLAQSIVSKVARDGSLSQFLGRFLMYVGLDAGGEFVQEGSQSLTSALLQALAERG